MGVSLDLTKEYKEYLKATDKNDSFEAAEQFRDLVKNTVSEKIVTLETTQTQMPPSYLTQQEEIDELIKNMQHNNLDNQKEKRHAKIL